MQNPDQPAAASRERPWYREPLVWLLIFPPAGAVLGGIVTAWLAGGPPVLVNRDEAALAVETDQGFVRDRAAVLARQAERARDGRPMPASEPLPADGIQ